MHRISGQICLYKYVEARNFLPRENGNVHWCAVVYSCWLRRKWNEIKKKSEKIVCYHRGNIFLNTICIDNPIFTFVKDNRQESKRRLAAGRGISGWWWWVHNLPVVTWVHRSSVEKLKQLSQPCASAVWIVSQPIPENRLNLKWDYLQFINFLPVSFL